MFVTWINIYMGVSMYKEEGREEAPNCNAGSSIVPVKLSNLLSL